MDERRHAKRVTVTAECGLLPATVPVQVLDISIAGVLLHASRPVPLGARGALRLSLAGMPVTADVVVERIVEAHGGYRLGASFVTISNEHRQVIERFMSQ